MEQQIKEVKKISLGRNAFNYGLFIGVALIVIALIYYLLNVSLESILNWIPTIILILGIILGILNFRKNINGGYINYGKSLGTGVLIGLFVSIIIGVYFYIYYRFIDPEALDKLRILAEEKLESNPNFPEDQLEYMRENQFYIFPLSMAVRVFISYNLISFVASLIISFFTRKADKSFEANFK